MDDTETILELLKKDKDSIYTPKELEEKSGLEKNQVRGALSKLIEEEMIERVERGKYRYSGPPLPDMDDKVKRYLSTLEKTCAIAIHELMLTEPLVGKADKAEIEHQIAYFARIMVRSRWELDHGTSDFVDIDEKVFKKAKKIHEWSKMVFEKSLAEKRK